MMEPSGTGGADIHTRPFSYGLQALKDLGLAACVRTKEEPDKEAMKNLPLETLAAVGASLRTEDAFGYEIDRDKLRVVGEGA
jgi:hypothetical protein